MKPVLLILLLFLVACSEPTQSAQRQCYTVEYLHISGNVQQATLQLTALEKERLHAASDEGSYYLSVARFGELTYLSDIRVSGATALLSIWPCR